MARCRINPLWILHHVPHCSKYHFADDEGKFLIHDCSEKKFYVIQILRFSFKCKNHDNEDIVMLLWTHIKSHICNQNFFSNDYKNICWAIMLKQFHRRKCKKKTDKSDLLEINSFCDMVMGGKETFYNSLIPNCQFNIDFWSLISTFFLSQQIFHNFLFWNFIILTENVILFLQSINPYQKVTYNISNITQFAINFVCTFPNIWDKKSL